MSLKTYILPDNTLDIAVSMVRPREQARQIDALLSIYAGIDDASKRLYALLLQMSQLSSSPVQIRLIIPVVWTLLDGLDRAFTIALKMKGIGCSNDDRDLMKLLSAARNSFHHLEDRIEHFFASNQGSVFGDLYWRYRPALDQEEVGYLLITSPIFGNPTPGFEHGLLNSPNPEVAHEVGIYDLRIFYLEGNPKNTVHKRIEFSVDQGLSVINTLMSFLYEQHKEAIERYKETLPNKQLIIPGLPAQLAVFRGGGNNIPKNS